MLGENSADGPRLSKSKGRGKKKETRCLYTEEPRPSLQYVSSPKSPRRHFTDSGAIPGSKGVDSCKVRWPAPLFPCLASNCVEPGGSRCGFDGHAPVTGSSSALLLSGSLVDHHWLRFTCRTRFHGVIATSHTPVCACQIGTDPPEFFVTFGFDLPEGKENNLDQTSYHLVSMVSSRLLRLQMVAAVQALLLVSR